MPKTITSEDWYAVIGSGLKLPTYRSDKRKLDEIVSQNFNFWRVRPQMTHPNISLSIFASTKNSPRTHSNFGVNEDHLVSIGEFDDFRHSKLHLPPFVHLRDLFELVSAACLKNSPSTFCYLLLPNRQCLVWISFEDCWLPELEHPQSFSSALQRWKLGNFEVAKCQGEVKVLFNFTRKFLRFFAFFNQFTEHCVFGAHFT